jgi:hypothetical protein
VETIDDLGRSYKVATRQYKVCDYCGAKDLDGAKIEDIFIQTGWEPDPAGGSSTPDGKSYDLCVTCLAKLCDHFLRFIKNFEVTKAVVKLFDSTRKAKV